jgi:chromosome segregation ATPase
MSRPGVTYQDISAAANQLKGQGKAITIENVRAILGTGSLGTINNHLRKWKEAQNTTHKIASKENIPEELVSIMKGLWEKVLTQATERFVPLEENYQNEVTELKTELEKYQSNNQRWQKLFNQWQQEKVQLDNEKLTLEQAITFARKENESLQTKQDGLTQQLQDKQQRIDELHRLHQRVQENLEHYRESVREQRLVDQQQFDQQKQQLHVEIKSLQEHTGLQRDNIIILQQSNQEMIQKYSLLETIHQDMNSQLQQVKQQLIEAEKTQYEFKQSSQHWESQCKALQQIVEHKTNSYIDIQAEFKLISQQLIDAKQSLNDLNHRNRLLADDKLQLLHEKGDLQGQLKQLQKAIVV